MVAKQQPAYFLVVDYKPTLQAFDAPMANASEEILEMFHRTAMEHYRQINRNNFQVLINGLGVQAETVQALSTAVASQRGSGTTGEAIELNDFIRWLYENDLNRNGKPAY